MKNHLLHHTIAIPFITMSPLHPSKKSIKKNIDYKKKRKEKNKRREREEGKRNHTQRQQLSHAIPYHPSPLISPSLMLQS